MTIDQLINLLATLTLIEMMITIGLGVTISQIAPLARDWRLVCRALFANYLLVPAAALGLIFLFHPHPMVAAGLLIGAVCPGAPYGPPFNALAKGDVVSAVALMVLLAASSALLAPLLLILCLPLLGGNEPLHIDVLKLVLTLFLSQLLPLCAGIFLREKFPALAARLKSPAGKISLLLNLSLLTLIIAAQFRMLLSIRLTAFLGMLLLVAAAFLAGWICGTSRNSGRKTLAITTSVRNVGVSLVIASGSFPGTPAIPAATAFAIFQTLLIALVALAWGRFSATKDHAMSTATP